MARRVGVVRNGTRAHIPAAMSAAQFEQVLQGAQATAVPSCDRQAALLLHSLDASSRRWVLERLQPQEKSLVAPLLAELSDLGVPADAPWLLSLLEPAAKPSGEASNDACRRRIESAAVSDIRRLLDGEPVELVRRLLALGPWPWGAELARSFGLQAPAAPKTARAIDSALLAALAQRLAAQEAPGPARKGIGRTLADVAIVIRRRFR